MCNIMYVRVEVENKRRFLEINDVQNLTFLTFVKQVESEFGVQNARGKKIRIIDHLETTVDSDKLLKYLIERNAETLVLKVHFLDANAGNKTHELMITSDHLEMYLDANGGKGVLSQYKKTKNLTEKLRHKMVNLVMDMAIERFGLYPTSSEKIVIAKATVKLFPVFKAKDTEHGIEMFFNPKNNGGWFVSVLKNRRLTSRRKKTEKNANESQAMSIEYTEDVAEKDIEYLRTAKINSSNMPIIKEKLLLTMDFRKKICENSDINLLERFPYFFVCPELILFEFNNSFEVDADIFSNVWSQYKNNVENVLELHGQLEDFATIFDEDVEQILMLLKVFPVRQQGRSTIGIRLPFNQAIEKLVVYCKTGTPPMNAIKEDNKQPYIIMLGTTPKNITQYFIVVEKELINVPQGFSFVDTFDLLFKAHYAFHLSFDESLKPMMHFIQHYFYKISPPQFNPTTHMIRIFNDISLSNADDSVAQLDVIS